MDPTSAPLTPALDAPPDWTTLTREILCPLCEYNLRGLAEPRCPECGHRFAWKELLDEENRVHPYLFEHHPEQNLRSLVVTQVRSLHFWRFWRDLQPHQKPRTRRLLVYWLISALPILLMLALLIAVPVWQERQSILQSRRDTVTSMKTFPFKKWIDEWIAHHGSLEAAAAARHPMPDIWRRLQANSLEVLEEPAWFMTGTLLAWPWVTVGALSIFQMSMRRKQIKFPHILRCVIYAIDCAFWVVVVQILGYLILTSTGSTGQRSDWIDLIAATDLGLCWLVVCRLTVAYRRYLRFDHPEGTVLLSQVIVALVFWKLFLMANGL